MIVPALHSAPMKEAPNARPRMIKGMLVPSKMPVRVVRANVGASFELKNTIVEARMMKPIATSPKNRNERRHANLLNSTTKSLITEPPCRP